MFTSTFDDDGRLYLLLYGAPKIGKTKSILNLIEHQGHRVIMISTDGGVLYAHKHPEVFNNKLAVANPRTLEETRRAFSLAGQKVKKLIDAGFPAQRIWVVLDNATHLQQRLLTEARKVSITRGPGNRPSTDKGAEYAREMTMEMDYQVNLGHMVEIADALDTFRCNVCVICLPKDETIGADRKSTGRIIPALSGQTATRFAGDADAIIHMDKDANGDRFFRIMGDRSGNLGNDPESPGLEPADLEYLIAKIHGHVDNAAPSDDTASADAQA